MEDDENVKVCKVIFLGELGVGKTCIIDRFINDNFTDEQKTIIPTYTVKTMTFDEFQGKSVNFEIWDTAGLEKYHALTKMFYKNAGVAILVYDITNKKSFEKIQKYWSIQIKKFSPKDISKKLYILKIIFFSFSHCNSRK